MQTKVTYIASDGKEFNKPEVCFDYESFLEFHSSVYDGVEGDTIVEICKYIWRNYHIVKRDNHNV